MVHSLPLNYSNRPPRQSPTVNGPLIHRNRNLHPVCRRVLFGLCDSCRRVPRRNSKELGEGGAKSLRPVGCAVMSITLDREAVSFFLRTFRSGIMIGGNFEEFGGSSGLRPGFGPLNCSEGWLDVTSQRSGIYSPKLNAAFTIQRSVGIYVDTSYDGLT